MTAFQTIKDFLSKPRHIKNTPQKIISLGFVLLILLGSVLLVLPISSNGTPPSYTDALFTSVSAVCVTGLVVVDTNVQYSVFGKAVILLLIQTGALGIMSVITLFSLLTGKTLGLRDRMTIQESFSNFTLAGIVRTFRSILLVATSIELTGACLLAIDLVPVYGWRSGIARSIFHSVSAFCNAGFDPYGSEGAKYVSLTIFNNKPVTLLTTAGLIIVGGLGFIVWNDIATCRKFSKYNLHTKLVLSLTAVLLVGGTVGYFLLEQGNTMRGMPAWQQWLNSFFNSVTARTAGFNSLPTDRMADSSGLLTILLMFIGAAPGSTAGGVKVTTVGVLLLTMLSFVRGRDSVQVFHSRIPSSSITKALVIVTMSAILVAVTTMVVLVDNDCTLLQALYEATSAFGTVGLSTGITPEIGTASKYMLMLTMLLGRIGPFTAIVAFQFRNTGGEPLYKYPEGKITVG